MREPIGVCVIVFDPTGRKILLGKRLGDYKPGTYGLPGGRIEKDEAMESAAHRELQEETGLSAQELRYLGVVREWQGENNFIHFIYGCSDYDGAPETMEPEKCEGWDWYDLNDLPKPLLPGHRWAIQMLQDGDGLVDVVDSEE